MKQEENLIRIFNLERSKLKLVLITHVITGSRLNKSSIQVGLPALNRQFLIPAVIDFEGEFVKELLKLL